MNPQDSTGTENPEEEAQRLARFKRMDARLRREMKCTDDPPLHRAHRWGGWFSFICKHRMWRRLKCKDLDALCQTHYGVRGSTAYNYARLFRCIPKARIQEAGKDVKYKDAMLIVRMKPPEWIKGILWDYLVVEKCRFAEMKRIVDGVQAALEALEGKDPPGEDWLRQVIEEARQEGPTETIRRALAKVSGGEARAVKRAVNSREMLEMLQDLEGVDLDAVQESCAEIEGQREQIEKLMDELRTAESSEKIPRGYKNLQDESSLKNEASNEASDDDPRGNVREGQQTTQQNQTVSGPKEGEKITPARKNPEGESSLKNETDPRKPAPKPDKWSPDQVDFPVNFPTVPRIGPLTIKSSLLLAAMYHAGTTMERFRDLYIGQGQTVHPKLQLLAWRAVDRFQIARSTILPALDEVAATGQARLDALLAKSPGTSAKDHFPLSLDLLAANKLPMAWLSYEALDPLMSEAPSECEVFVWHFLALVDTIEKLTEEWAELVEQGEPMADILGCQLKTALLDTGGRMSRFRFLCQKAALLWAKKEEAEEAALALFRQQAQSRIITLGESSLAAQYVIVGMTQDGRLVAISLNTPQLILGLGRQGAGKSHLAVLLMEGAAIRWPGTGHLVYPMRVIRIGGDWHQGVSGDSLKAGFYPNADPTQWEYLRNYYAIQRGNAAFRAAYLFCLPDSLAHFQLKFADLVRRGLIILPLEMDPSEMAHYGYASYLTGGAEGQAKGRAAWKTLIDNIISWHGEDVTPQLLERELKKHKLDYRVKGPLELQLRQLGRIVVPGKYLVDRLERGCPVIVYLESRYLGKDQVLPLELAVMNALSRPMRNGEDPPRIIIIDEFNANLMNEGTAQLLLEAASQLRHRPIWYYLSGQRITDFPSGIGALATIIAIFNTPSKAEFRREQDIFGVLEGKRYHKDIFRLQDGQAIMAGVRASDLYL